jgi:hypothetical protein
MIGFIDAFSVQSLVITTNTELLLIYSLDKSLGHAIRFLATDL